MASESQGLCLSDPSDHPRLRPVWLRQPVHSTLRCCYVQLHITSDRRGGRDGRPGCEQSVELRQARAARPASRRGDRCGLDVGAGHEPESDHSAR